MSLSSYPRTDGLGVLAATFEAVRKFQAIPADEVLDPAERLSYWSATHEERRQFDELAANELTRPPEFLQFSLAALLPGEEPPHCAGEAPRAEGLPPTGSMSSELVERAAREIGMSPEAILAELTKFSGPVQLVVLPAGKTLYRTIGLTTGSASHGTITNKLLGPYWEPVCPREHGDISTWRAKTAVLPQWNGDWGYIEVTLKKDVTALQGMVAMQPLGGSGDRVLPGGGQQIYLPQLRADWVTQDPASLPLSTLIQPSYLHGHVDGSATP